MHSGVMNAAAGMAVKRERLGQRPHEAPVPFLWGDMIAQIVARDCLRGDFDQSGHDVFVRVRTGADEKSGNADFPASGAMVEVVKTGLGVGGCRPDLSDRENFPFLVAKRGEITSRRRDFSSYSARNRQEPAVFFSRRLRCFKLLRFCIRGD